MTEDQGSQAEGLDDLVRDNLLRTAQEAKELLSNPMLKAFFEQEAKNVISAFYALPYGATVDEYRTVHHRGMAVRDLKQSLQQHIQEFDLQVYRDELLKKETI